MSAKAEDLTDAQVVAAYAVSPLPKAATTLGAYSDMGGLGLAELVGALRTQVDAVNTGDLGRAESILTAQAHSLDAMFNHLAQKATGAEYLPQLETYLRLALKAQAQCRATIEALAAIKNPPVIITKQANFSGGHQQINNGTPAPAHGQPGYPQTQLLEQNDGPRLDIGAAAAAVSSDPAVETLVEVHRPQDRRG